MRLTEEKQEKIQVAIAELIKLYERVSDAPAAERRLHNVRDEIANRIIENYKLVGNREQAFRQVLIVLADYASHSWAYGACATEKQRLQIADYIMAFF